MSVFVLSPAQFGAIAATLSGARNSWHEPIFPLSAAEKLWHRDLLGPRKHQSEAEFASSLIDPFVFRLYLANALAGPYTYMTDDQHEFMIPLLELPDSKPLPLRELLQTLQSLSYNLVTNGGNTFLGVKDAEKLRQIIANIQSELIHQHDAD